MILSFGIWPWRCNASKLRHDARRLRYRAWSAALVACCSLAASAEPPQLDLLDLSIPPDTEIRFTEGRAREEAGLPFDPLDRSVIIEAGTPTYRLLVNINEVSFDENFQTGFIFPAFLVPRGDQARSFRYLVHVEVLGNVVDSIKEVGFHVDAGELRETGTLLMPVYSPSPTPHVEVRHDDVFRIELGEEGRFPIVLTNQLERIPTRLRLQSGPSGRTNAWESMGVTAATWSDGAMELTPGVPQNLAIVARIDPFAALVRGFLPPSMTGPHDVLDLHLEYNTRGGRPVVVPVQVAVHFVPSLLALVAAIFAGAVLANVALLAIRRPGLPDWLRGVVASLALSIGFWVVSLGLYQAQNRVQLFGLDINPFEIVGAGIIGFLVGLSGPRALDLFHDYQKRRTASMRPAASDQAGGG